MTSHSVFIALGSNVGDSKKQILDAMKRLESFSSKPILRSSLWQTTPVDCPPGSPLFINAAVAISPLAGETPESLLEKLQSLEIEWGRQPKKVMNESRPLDLDIIAFGSEVRKSEKLVLPHPRFAERQFVLKALVEIAPSLIVPGQSKSVKQISDALPPDPAMRRVE